MGYLAFLKEAGAFAIAISGLPQLIRNVYARNRATIVTYHDPTPEILEQHLSYLSKRYNFIPMALLADALNERDWSRLPPRSLVITLDDGHRGNYRLLDIFKKYGVVPTIYLCTGIVGTNRHYWWTKAENEHKSRLKSVPNSERLRELEQRYRFTNHREYPEESRQALAREELSEMLPFVEVGSHTLTHPILTECTDDESGVEIAASKREAEALSPSTECRHFSYPNGNYGEREEELVKKAGYRTARTIDVGWNDVNSNPYRLRITGIPDNASKFVMIAHLTGIPLYLKYLSKGSFNGRFIQ